jgi:CubicO group peptidase (beta-lactamase class C family)
VAPEGSRAALEDILRATRTLSFLIIRHDSIEYEYYSSAHGPEALSQYFSVSKSILSTLVGMAIDDGVIRSIDQSVTDYIPELSDRGFADVTLRQLIDMTSALDYEENDNPFGLHVLMNYTSQVESMVLGFRTISSPLGHFRYRSGDTALLSLALRRALRTETLTDYAQRRLWGPLGMEHRALWTVDRDGGFEKAWCCIAGTARDLAKVGRLYLANGQVGQERLVSADWVIGSTPKPGSNGERAYTHGWWPATRNGTDFAAVGKDGQFLYVSPDYDTIIVRLGERLGYDSMDGWMSLFAELAAHDPPLR